MKNLSILITLLFFVLTSAFSQEISHKRIKSKPKGYKRPIQLKDIDEMKKFEINELAKEKKSFWAVLNVMDGTKGNYTYERPNRSKLKDTLDYLDAFYIIDEEGEWLELGKPLKENFNDRKVDVELFGWIHKSNVLQWTNSLSTRNLIHLKAFSVNRVSGVSKSQDLTTVNIYDHWDFDNANVIGDLPLESFYYIYKKKVDPVSGLPLAYLIGKDNSFDPFDKNSKCILGWIREGRVDLWNTRLAIAPSFNPSAYKERKKNPGDLRMRGYDKKKQADDYINKSGSNHESGIFWDYDPVLEKENFISKQDMMRLSKNIMRLPILDNRSNGSVVMSTTLQSLSGSSESNTVDILKQEGKELALNIQENINIYFLLDGSSTEVKKRIPTIKQTIRDIREQTKGVPNLRVGAGVYLDCKSSCEKPFSSKSLSQDIERTLVYLDDVIHFDCPADRDPATCLQNGVLKSLKQANFTEDGASNMLIHIGDQGDIKYYRNRKLDTRKFSNKYEEIQELLRKYSINYVAVDVSQEEGNLFFRSVRPLMSNVMNEIVSDNIDRLERGGLNVEDILNADLPNFSGNGPINISAISCPLIYAMKGPALNQKITSQELKTFILEKFNEFIKKIEKTSSLTQDIAENGITNLESGATFPPEILMAIEMQLKKISKGSITDDELKEFFNRSKGVKFQKAVYIPMDYKAWGGRFTPYSYVLFMPGDDLYDFTESIRKLLDAYDSPSEAREKLRLTLEKLVLSLTGEKKVRKDFNLEDLEKIVLGLEDTTLDLKQNNSLLAVKIRDVENSRKFSDEMFIKYRDILRKRKEILDEIRQPGGDYEFKYKSSNQNEYYWITLDNMISIN